MYAIIETGGKQYKLEVGQEVEVELLEANVGETIELDHVLVVADGEQVQMGKPVLEAARVAATVMAHGRGRKVLFFRYNPKKRFRVKKGHRQGFTRLRIDAITA